MGTTAQLTHDQICIPTYPRRVKAERIDTLRLARVQSVTGDGYTFVAEFRNGDKAEIECDETLAISEGQCFYLIERDDGVSIELTDEPWQTDARTVGVIRHIADGEAVLETNFGMVAVPIDASAHDVGETVVLSSDLTIERTFSSFPIRARDAEVDNASMIGEYKFKTDELDATMDAIGGYEDLKRRILKFFEIHLRKRDEVAAIGATPSRGLLLTGPPGTGKTLLARVIAKEMGATLYLVNGPQIISKWVGESETVLRQIFDDAERQDLAIVFIDEFDSLGSRRTDDSHEAAKRLVAQLLTLMDGFDPDKKTIVVAATNRVDDIDPALRRAGRFDEELHFHLPTESDREQIIELVLAAHVTHEDIDVQWLVESTQDWSPADVAAIVRHASHAAVLDGRDSIRPEDLRIGWELQEGMRRLV